MSIDAASGAHLDYEYHSDYMDSVSVFDVHARGAEYFSRHVTKVGGSEQLNATCYKDNTAYVLYPDEMRGNVATTLSSNVIADKVLMLDELYKTISQAAKRTDYTMEERTLEDGSFTVQLYPAGEIYGSVAFYFDDAGRLVHVLADASPIAPQLGETFYTIRAIDAAVDDSLFDLSGYTIG